MTSLASGHKAVAMEGRELARQMKDWSGYPSGLVRLSPGGWVLPTEYLNFADKIYNFKFRSSDVVVMTWPKCGTMWTQEIVWTMRNNPDLDNPMATLPIMARSPYLDMDLLMGEPWGEDNPFMEKFNELCSGKDQSDGLMLQLSEATPDPRTIKSHLPFSLLPPDLLHTAKVVYVARNPKDVLISFHHHCRLFKLHGYLGSFQDFVQYFIDDDLVYSPYWLHVKEAWEKRHHPNLHFIFYEDMKADVMGELKKLNTFLSTNLNEQQLQNIVKHTSFKEMKDRKVATGVDEEEMDYMNANIVRNEGGFFRKGEVGDWKGRLTPELEAKVDKWIADNMTTDSIKMKYSL